MTKNILEGLGENEEVNIHSAEQLIEKLEGLPASDLFSYVEEISDMKKSLRDGLAIGIDTHNVRVAITRLNQLTEKAQEEYSRDVLRN